MKAKGIFIPSIDGESLLAVDDRAKAIVSGLDPTKKVLAWVHTARYPEHHRLAFAVMGKIADAIGATTECVLLWLKYETGRFDFVRLPDGTTEKSPHSIAFESMSQEDFQKFWNDALVPIRETVLPKVDDRTYNEIRDMIAGKVDAEQERLVQAVSS
jgi:hypothetical protein